MCAKNEPEFGDWTSLRSDSSMPEMQFKRFQHWTSCTDSIYSSFHSSRVFFSPVILKLNIKCIFRCKWIEFSAVMRHFHWTAYFLFAMSIEFLATVTISMFHFHPSDESNFVDWMGMFERKKTDFLKQSHFLIKQMFRLMMINLIRIIHHGIY